MIKGERHVLRKGEAGYPAAFDVLSDAPDVLYAIGDVAALTEGLGVIGARKATPYGLGCAKRFALIAAQAGVGIVSGGARGCDSAGHRAALDARSGTVAVLGGGLDKLYPRENIPLFQEIVDGGGLLVSEHPWDVDPLPYFFRLRNRLIAALSKALLIVEAGLPSGTFSTADAALEMGREVWVVPGSIVSSASRGSNRLLYQGAIPVVDDESFKDVLHATFGTLKAQGAQEPGSDAAKHTNAVYAHAAHSRILEALRAQTLGIEALRNLVREEFDTPEAAISWLMIWLANAQRDGLVARYADGKYGPSVRTN